MKWVAKEALCVGRASSFAEAIEAAFGEATLAAVHDANVTVLKPWSSFKDPAHQDLPAYKRSIAIETPFPPQFPDALRPFAGTDRLRMTVHQSGVVMMGEGACCERMEVRNRMRVHVLFAELCSVKPKVLLARNPETQEVFFSAEVRLDAILPPPVAELAETFMALTCTRNLDAYAACIAAQLLQTQNQLSA